MSRIHSRTAKGECGGGGRDLGGQTVKLVVILGKSETRMTASILKPDP